MSCRTTSILELDNRIPVSPPRVKRKIKPLAHSRGTEEPEERFAPYKLASHLNTLTPVGTAIVIVAAVK